MNSGNTSVSPEKPFQQQDACILHQIFFSIISGNRQNQNLEIDKKHISEKNPIHVQDETHSPFVGLSLSVS